MPKGGARPGAGRPKGRVSQVTEELAGKIDSDQLIKVLMSIANGEVDCPVRDRISAASVLLSKRIPNAGRPDNPDTHDHQVILCGFEEIEK